MVKSGVDTPKEAIMALTHMKIKELLDENREHNCDGYGHDHLCLRIAAIADLPSRFGDFHIVSFWNNIDEKEHAAIVHGDVCDKEDVPVRVHSECLTGDALGSLRCDCRDQLEAKGSSFICARRGEGSVW